MFLFLCVLIVVKWTLFTQYVLFGITAVKTKHMMLGTMSDMPGDKFD